MTPAQIRNIHIAKSHVHLGEEQYRLMLANVAGVSSSKQLTQAQYEDCMAILEDMGYRQCQVSSVKFQEGQETRNSKLETLPEDYWRRIVSRRGTFANARLINKICQLYREYEVSSVQFQGGDSKLETGNSKLYPLSGLVRRVSADRTPVPDQLTPREALNLIECLKGIINRSLESRVLSPEQPSVPPQDSSLKTQHFSESP